MTKQWELPGIRIEKKDIESGKVITVRENPCHRYARDLGIAWGRFLAEHKRGRLIGSKCNKCKRVVLPPRIFCEYCFRNMDEWIYLPDTGTVRTFTLMYINVDGERLEQPRIVGFIEIDGVSKDIGLLGFLSEIDPKDVRFGMRVKAVWKPEGERKGHVLDIKYFKPL
jgi:hypothetical protein